MTESVLSVALDALEHGACVVPGMTDGSKRPIGRWREWQSKRPTPEQVGEWFGDGHPAMGVICGEVSGRLEVLEIEGKAMDLWGPLRERLDSAGMLDVFKAVSLGYTERSPSGGLHFAYRLMDDGSEMPGNTKLAARRLPDGSIETMIETRGEGGFMMIAPSNGPTHDTGKPYEMVTGGWDSILTISRSQRDGIVRVCESFDEMPPADPPTPAPRPSADRYTGEGWMDRALSAWTDRNPIESVLANHGWTYLETDSMGQLWRRPGKGRGSCSARVNLRGRLHVFSTSTPFKAGGRASTTYDALDVQLTYAIGRPPTGQDRVTAMRAFAQAEGIIEPSAHEDWSFVGEGSGATNHGNECSGTEGTNLPEDFWNARPYLAHIRQAAHARVLSPDGVLGAVLARYCTTIPTTLLLPAIVGSYATFDYTSMLVARSGGGKSTSMACAAELLDVRDDKLLFDPPIGSGEGLIQAFLESQQVELNGEKVTQQVQVLDGIHLSVDEGTVLGAQMRREGTTIAQTLCSAWVGAPLGQLNAASHTKRIIPRYHARITAVMGIQQARGEHLVTGPAADMGLPQRMVFFSMEDSTIPDDPSDWPGPLDVPIIDRNSWTLRAPIKVAPEIAAEIRRHRHSVVTGKVAEELLDSHRFLAQLKTAGAFAFMDGRWTIDTDDWELARQVVDISRNVRSTILQAVRLAQVALSAGRAQRQIEVTLAVDDAAHERSVRRGATALAKKMHRLGGVATRSVLSQSIASRDKKEASVDEMIEHAVSLRWVVEAEGGFAPGEARPV